MKKVIVCINYRANPTQPSCGARNGQKIADLIEQDIAENGLAIELDRFNCLGQCDLGPNLRMAPNGEFYHSVQISDIPLLLQKIRAFVDEAPRKTDPAFE